MKLRISSALATAARYCALLAFGSALAQQPAEPPPAAANASAPAPLQPETQPPKPNANAPEPSTNAPQPEANTAPAPAPTKIDYSKYLSDGKIGYAALAVEKATISKALADELYLRDERKAAEKSYRDAMRTLEEEAPDARLDDTQKSVKRLLAVDVEYRLLNLRLGNDFWSGYRTSRPSTPHLHLLILEDLLADLEKQTKELNELLDKKNIDDGDMARLQGQKIQLEGEIRGQAQSQEREIIKARKERMQLGTWDQRVRHLTGQRLAVETRSKQLAEEQKQLSASASSLLVQAVAAGTGIPTEATSAVIKGDLKAALLQTAAAQLGDPNSAISNAVGDVSSGARQLQDLYSTASKNYESLKQTGDTLKQAADVIRKPTFEGLAKAGASLWEKIPEKDRKRLAENVASSSPASGMLEAYRRVELSVNDAITLRKRIETLALQKMAMRDIRADLMTVARQVIKTEEQARAQMRSVFRSIAAVNLSDEQFRQYGERFLRAGAADFFARIPAADRQSVAEAMGEPTVESAIAKLATDGIGALPKGRVSNDRIVLEADGKRVEVKLKELFAGAQFGGTESGIKDLPAIFADMTRTEELYRVALAQLPEDILGVAVETALRKIPTGKERQEAIEELSKGLSADAQQRAKQKLVEQAVGSAVVKDLVTRKEAASRMSAYQPYPSSGGSATGLSPAASAAATAALNYAIPGAGVALSMAQSFAKMDANVDEMNRLAEQSLRIMAEQEQLHDLATEAYFQFAIAEVEQRRAEILRDSAERQLGVYSTELSRRANSGKRNHFALGMRRALTYYSAERLREEFDLFDRSLAMWSSGVAGRGAVSSQIQLDPSNTRYALDSSIHLFDWLNRERESTRGDPDSLRQHWRQMFRLAKDVCTRRGCKPGDGMLGQITSTGSISVKEVLATDAEWRRFKDWQRNPSGKFVMQFSILPGLRIIPLHYENIRIIDLRMAGRTGGRDEMLSQVGLRHSGISHIPRADPGSSGGLIFQREALLPRQSAGFNKPTDFNLTQLRARHSGIYTQINYPILGDFEGYGLYALYQLTFENTAENRKLDDVLIRFAYFYNDASNIVSEEQYLNSLRSTTAALPFEIYDYRLISKVSPTCSGPSATKADTVETRVATVPVEMRASFASAFSRAAEPGNAESLDFLPAANRAQLQTLQSCLQTRVERACKPIAEIKRIAASWAAAQGAPPSSELPMVLDTQVPADDGGVDPAIRKRYMDLCGSAS